MYGASNGNEKIADSRLIRGEIKSVTYHQKSLLVDPRHNADPHVLALPCAFGGRRREAYCGSIGSANNGKRTNAGARKPLCVETKSLD